MDSVHGAIKARIQLGFDWVGENELNLKPFIKDELIIPKHRIPYFNYRKYSNINAVNTYMLVIYNKINSKVAENLHYNFDKIIELDKENFFCK